MKITVSLAQMAVVAGQPEKNLAMGESFIAEAARRKSDIICFPEMWTTGFDWSANARIAATHEKAIDRIAAMARCHHIWITGSTLTLNENKKLSNAAIIFDPKGARIGTYRKIHLFSGVGEDSHIEPGRSPGVFNTPWGLTGIAICYDIRFPELFRSYALKGVKIVFIPSAFPEPKLEHWKVLLRARAIEDQMFVIGVNRTGEEERGPEGIIKYFGTSMIVGPWGDIIVEGSRAAAELITADIDLDKADEIRNNMKVFDDRQPDLYR